MKNTLYYGDNLEVLRKYIRDETIDLCYIDPPFNSKRNYNQIYNNIGTEDKAQALAFIDTWVWDSQAMMGYNQILSNDEGRFAPQSVALIKGLKSVLGEGSLLAYLISMTLRITEIHRVLKETGSFYLHCDPTSSHYLKLILDSIFVSQGGEYQNEIAWCYGSGGASKRHFSKKHDVIFFYTKGSGYTFNVDAVREAYSSPKKSMTPKMASGKEYVKMNPKGRIPFDWWQIPILTNSAKERMGYPTQKPEALLEKIIDASSNEGDIILDAYCGCGTTVAVAERMKRNWIGIDITYQSISLMLRRLEGQFGEDVLESISLNGIPKDINSAKALANKKDDRLRKEFEKWAVLVYSNNRARINSKKGADEGIDGVAYFQTSKDENEKIIFQVKSGKVGRGDIAKLRGDMEKSSSALGIFITLENPTKPMIETAKAAGLYHHKLMQRDYDRIQIVSIKDIIENNSRLNMPLSVEVLKEVSKAKIDNQGGLFE